MNPYLSAFLRHAWRFLQGVCRISWHLLTAILTFIERFVLESARLIARAHGGDISYIPEKGGTRFVLKIPILN
jgi:hypothetical protein